MLDIHRKSMNGFHWFSTLFGLVDMYQKNLGKNVEMLLKHWSSFRCAKITRKLREMYRLNMGCI